ncbi:unnamed protein product [Adineta steineri]|uniref:Histone H2A n=1 Tax=Adineta steineri TaxID=433720 RepID=A0A820EQQ7_9BILA|nr:unnamed protein product [Adineta steineri]CAF0937546.1 unnamed protein product [Adineta steineri]CAF3664364.1 unnamed protein product [Adineta steineri]CAF4250527.1 unnamed protein product [Adineta steineri]
MANNSTNTNSISHSLSDNNGTLRLSMDSNQELDINNNDIQQHSDKNVSTNKTNSTSSGYMTRSKKAGLVFPVSRVENHLRKGRYAKRISPQASVYLASVLEYLVAETVELAGDMTRKGKRKRITPRDIALAIKNDHELAKLCTDVTIPEGGVQPFIHEVLLKSSQRRRTRRVKFNIDDDNGL